VSHDAPREEAVELALHTFLAEHTQALSTALAEVQANGGGRSAAELAADWAVSGVTGFAAAAGAGEPLDHGVVVHTPRVDIHLVIRLHPPARAVGASG
jgi:hypothetical protein